MHFGNTHKSKPCVFVCVCVLESILDQQLQLFLI